MLASKNRLKKKVNFARIEIDGKTFQSESFGIAVFDRKDQKQSKFGIITSTKISKKAIVRNKIKRIILEVVRKKLGDLKRGFDVLFLTKAKAVKTERKKLENEVEASLSKYL